jgi:aminoglycoside phosphotransferase (APT) family kinase protein
MIWLFAGPRSCATMTAMPERKFPEPIIPEEIRQTIGEIDNITHPTQGMTSQVMILHGRHGIFVAKRATQPRYRAWLQREYTVLQALAETSLPVPRVHSCVSSAHADRESWLLMSYLPGEPLRESLRNTADRMTRRNLLMAFGELLQTVHSCPLPTALDQETIPWLDRTLEQAAYALQHEVVDGTPELLRYVQHNRPLSIQETLIHGDCTLDNVLVDNRRISGLIDWAGGGRGDPRHDLALATQAEHEAFQSAGDYDAFYSGYTGERLTEEEQAYFLALDEFF